MSWSVSIVGRARAVADQVKEVFDKAGGCPAGSAEEVAKIQVGAAVGSLAASLIGSNDVIRIEASGSCWSEGGVAKSQTLSVKFETIYNFVE